MCGTDVAYGTTRRRPGHGSGTNRTVAAAYAVGGSRLRYLLRVGLLYGKQYSCWRLLGLLFAIKAEHSAVARVQRGSDIGYSATNLRRAGARSKAYGTILRTPYAMSGTGVAYGTMHSLCDVRCSHSDNVCLAVCGTEIAYAGGRQRVHKALAVILSSKWFNGLMIAITVYALFVPDFYFIAASSPSGQSTWREIICKYRPVRYRYDATTCQYCWICCYSQPGLTVGYRATANQY
eukprot:3720713-Rhodomonas_salina.2